MEGEQLVKFSPQQQKIFQILQKNFRFEPESDTVIFYHKKIKNNEIALEELSEILNRRNSPKSEKMKKEFDINYFEKKISLKMAKMES